MKKIMVMMMMMTILLGYSCQLIFTFRSRVFVVAAVIFILWLGVVATVAVAATAAIPDVVGCSLNSPSHSAVLSGRERWVAASGCQRSHKQSRSLSILIPMSPKDPITWYSVLG